MILTEACRVDGGKDAHIRRPGVGILVQWPGQRRFKRAFVADTLRSAMLREAFGMQQKDRLLGDPSRTGVGDVWRVPDDAALVGLVVRRLDVG